jgi:hypothetical protein
MPVLPCSYALVLQLYLGTRAPFVVPIFGTTLMPAAPGRPGQNAFPALLRGQHEAPEEAPNLPDTQSQRSPRAALKVAKLLGAGWVDIFFGASFVGRWTARSTVNSA